MGWSLLGIGGVLTLFYFVLYRNELKTIAKALVPDKKPEESAAEGSVPEEEEEVDIPTKELNRLHASILILATGGMMVILFPPLPVVEAQEPRPIPPVTTGPTQEVVFPDLDVQGITLRKSGNSVMIRRRTYFEGEMVRGARIVSITPSNLTLEVQGVSNTVALPSF